MNAYETIALEATVDTLDQETARRVARLVVECRVSIPLALSAVQDGRQQRAQPFRPPAPWDHALAGLSWRALAPLIAE